VFIDGIGGLTSGVTAFSAVSVAIALCPRANESRKYFKICSLVLISSGPFVAPIRDPPGGGSYPRMYLDTRVEVTGDASGTHIALWPKKSASEEALVAHAASRGVGISGISHCFITRPSRPGIILGYSRMNEREIREGIRRLSETF
jgi:hypothetical protein